MIATGDNRCGCRSDVCQCEADLGFDIKPWRFLSEQLRARAAQAGEFLQKRTMARPDSAYLPWWDQCGTTGGGCCDLFRHRAHIQVRKRNNWRVAGQTLIQDFPAVEKKIENIMRLLKRWKKKMFTAISAITHWRKPLFVVEWFNLVHLDKNVCEIYAGKQIGVKSNRSIALHWNGMSQCFILHNKSLKMHRIAVWLSLCLRFWVTAVAC